MSGKSNSIKTTSGVRRGSRVHCLRDITIACEGRNEEILVRAPDLSATGMFISTSRPFAEGTVLNLRFRLAVSNVEVQTRAEVRHCLPGVGVGVEFIAISPEAAKAIAYELSFSPESRRGPKKRVARPPHLRPRSK